MCPNETSSKLPLAWTHPGPTRHQSESKHAISDFLFPEPINWGAGNSSQLIIPYFLPIINGILLKWLSEKRSDIQTFLSTTTDAANPYSGTLL
jgi:hypothetical protein